MKGLKGRYEGWGQLLPVAVAVVVLRLLYVDAWRILQDGTSGGTAGLMRFFSNWWAVAFTFVLDTGLVLLVNKKMSYPERSSARLWADAGIVVFVSIAGLLPLYGGHFRDGWETADGPAMLLSAFGLLMVNFVVVSVMELLLYFRHSHTILEKEQQQRSQAEYQYRLLRQQLNPHFLFNCLNILDYLIATDEKARASEYLRKLAGVYRYLLAVEGREVVELREERDFMLQYTALLRERFPEGLIVNVQVEEEALASHIVPLTIQVLLENAIKHNVVSAEQPLRVTVGTERGKLFVTNNLQQRLSTASTGIGLRNIDSQYRNLTGRGIEIARTEKQYTVRVNLL